MKIYSMNVSPTNFKSRNNPVKPFVVDTPKGKLFIKEFQQADADSLSKSKTLTKFFLDSFIGNTKDPWFLGLKKDEKNIIMH